MFIHNHPKLEATKTSFNMWMNKQTSAFMQWNTDDYI